MKRRLVIGGLGLVGAVLAGFAVLTAAQPVPGRTIVNPGFEEASLPPPGWILDAEAAGKGSVARAAVPGAEGQALALAPNARNHGGDKPLGLGQMISVEDRRGRRLTLKARLGAKSGAAAILGLALLDAKGTLVGAPAYLRVADALPLAEHALTLDEPVPAEAQNALLVLTAEGQSGTAYFDAVSLASAEAAPAAEPGTPFQARIVLDPGQDLGPVRRRLFGTNVEWTRNAQGLWNTQTDSLDATMLSLARQAGVSVLRFPGGGWSDSYDWRKGVGPRELRPRAIHAPGEPEESPNPLGTDEIIEAARAIGADLLLTLNLGDGTPELAAEWVRYVRARLDPATGPRVTWELGNELYMAEDISRAQTDPATYVARARATIAAVRAVDPQARFYAIGLENFGRYRFNAHADWNATVLRELGSEIAGLAIHNGYAPLLPGAAGSSPASVYRAMLAAPANMAANLDTTAAQLDRADPGRRLALAVTEWGPLFAVDPNNPYFDHVKTLGSGVFVARVLNVLLRHPRVAEAEFFKLSDLLNMGWIGRKPGGGYAATPALDVLRLYATGLSGRLIGTRVEGPTFSGGPVGFVDRVEAAPLVDAVAGLSEAGELTILVSNASLDAPAEITIDLDRSRTGTLELISGPAPDASHGTGMIEVPGLSFAPTADFGQKRPEGRDEVALTKTAVEAGERVRLSLPPASVAALRLRAQP